MNKLIIALGLVSSINFSTYAQETKSYLADNEQYKKAVDLFQKKNYPASYRLLEHLLNKESNHKDIIPSEEDINAQLMQALSATYSGRGNGIFLVESFLNKYPYHPNASEARLQLAAYYFKERNFDQAEKLMNNINEVDLTPEQLEQYNINRGYILFVKKDFKNAQRFLAPVANGQSATGNLSNRTEATYYLGLSQYFLGDYGAAMETLQKVEEQEKYYTEVPYYRARILFEQGNYNETIRFVEPILGSRIKRSPEVNQLLGQSYYNLEQYDKALPLLERYSTKTKQQSPEAQYQLAYTQYKMGKYSKAVKSFEKLNIVDNETGQYAIYALGDSYLKINDKEKAKNAFGIASKLEYNKQIQESALFNEAKLSYELGRSNEAITLVNNFIQKYPNSQYTREANEILVNLFLTSNNYQDALGLLKAMPNRSNQMNEAYQKVSYFRAVELYNNGELAAAKPLFDEAIKTSIDQRYVALSNYWLGEMAYEYNRYNVSEQYIQRFLGSSVQKPQRYIAQANYTLGYIDYKKKNYSQAIQHFAKVDTQQPFYSDASLRAADSYFAQKNYSQAKQNYTKAINGSPAESDYASYQLAILSGLNGNRAKKVNDLKQLYTTKPNSAYADDAMYETARVYMTQENYSSAQQLLETSLQRYPNSDIRVNTLNQLGLVNYNQRKYDKAISYYDQIVQNYPSSEEAAAALVTIQQIYIENGKPNEYFAYLKKVKGVSVSSAEQEQIIYSAAENQYQSGNCGMASNGFTDYINQFPNGIYAANAYFYRGECYNQSGNINEAIVNFEQVTQLPNNKFTERSLIRMARYEYMNGNYQDAINYFNRVQSINNSSIYTEEVQIGLMQSYNQLRDRNEAARYADIVLKQGNTNANVLQEAKFINGVQHYNVGNKDQAYMLLNDVAKTNKDAFGAEARYLLGQILYDKQQYNQSIEALYRVSDETPSEDNWVAKSFILIADNYVALNELFQAKATLNSVIENYSGNDSSIIADATRKKNEIEQRERFNSNIVNPQFNNQLQLQEN